MYLQCCHACARSLPCLQSIISGNAFGYCDWEVLGAVVQPHDSLYTLNTIVLAARFADAWRPAIRRPGDASHTPVKTKTRTNQDNISLTLAHTTANASTLGSSSGTCWLPCSTARTKPATIRAKVCSLCSKSTFAQTTAPAASNAMWLRRVHGCG